MALVGSALVVPPVEAAAPTQVTIFDADAAGRYPTTQASRPWLRNRGTLATSYAGGLPASENGPVAAAVGTNVFAWLPRFVHTFVAEPTPVKTAYAWVTCPNTNSLQPATPLSEVECRVVQSHPAGPTQIRQGRVQPVGDTWRIVPPGEVALGKSVTFTLTPDVIGTYVALSYTLESRVGNAVFVTTGTSSPMLVMPANIEVTTPATVRAAIAGGRGQWLGRPTAWGPAPAGTSVLQRGTETTAWVCTSRDAASDTNSDWAVRGGCTSTAMLGMPGGSYGGTLAPDTVGKYLVLNSVLRVTGPNGQGFRVPIDAYWMNRSQPVLIRALGDPAAQVLPEAADGAAPALSPSNDSSSAAPAASADPAAAGSSQEAAAGTPERAALGAGVDLAVAPLAGADGQGSGASAGLAMQLAASTRVKAGRFVTMKAVMDPKASRGRIRLAFVRFNAKGQPIASKAIYAPVKKGIASKRWRIPMNYTPSSYTLVATFEPAVKGAPGLTRTAPVSILAR